MHRMSKQARAAGRGRTNAACTASVIRLVSTTYRTRQVVLGRSSAVPSPSGVKPASPSAKSRYQVGVWWGLGPNVSRKALATRRHPGFSKSPYTIQSFCLFNPGSGPLENYHRNRNPQSQKIRPNQPELAKGAFHAWVNMVRFLLRLEGVRFAVLPLCQLVLCVLTYGSHHEHRGRHSRAVRRDGSTRC